MRIVISLLAGLLFGTGLVVSDMVNPARVLGFLRIASGAWDPTLAFVMGGALIPMTFAWRQRARMKEPVASGGFPAAASGLIDRRLLAGAAIFGAGWGLAGLCPGPALAGLTVGGWPIALFVVAMLAGMFLAGRFTTR